MKHYEIRAYEPEGIWVRTLAADGTSLMIATIPWTTPRKREAIKVRNRLRKTRNDYRIEAVKVEVVG
jgi:hypothetical protein